MSIEITKGSEKQVAWAQDIRDQEVVNVEIRYAHMPESLMRDDGPILSKSFELAVEKLKGEAPSDFASKVLCDARMWIDPRRMRGHYDAAGLPPTIMNSDHPWLHVLWAEAWREVKDEMADEQAAWDAEEEVREAERAARRAKNRKPWQK